jgi:uncharacterized protein (TIGR00255 family)
MTQPVASMTGFSRSEGAVGRLAWAWELRGVNGRGLDLKIRLPPGAEALEPALREAAGRVVKRGNVTANLSVQREAQGRLAIDEPALEQALSLALALAARIGAGPPRAEALLALPGVMRQGASEPEEDAAPAYRLGFEAALAGFAEARRSEGARLSAIMASLLVEIEDLCREAQAQAADQPQAQRARMLETVRSLLAEAPGLPEERIAQEVALLASRSDVREELDRLDSHLRAARDLLDEGGPIGRRLDFLVQEFNREANTLCAKSASVALTATGLRLKAAIEQMREQVQNIE